MAIPQIQAPTLTPTLEAPGLAPHRQEGLLGDLVGQVLGGGALAAAPAAKGRAGRTGLRTPPGPPRPPPPAARRRSAPDRDSRSCLIVGADGATVHASRTDGRPRVHSLNGGSGRADRWATHQADRIPTGDGSSGRQMPHRMRLRPAFPLRPAFSLVRASVEPPAGIEPATPSLPWNHREPLCGPPFSQVTPDRQGQG
jgi:hypothetical protein